MDTFSLLVRIFIAHPRGHDKSERAVGQTMAFGVWEEVVHATRFDDRNMHRRGWRTTAVGMKARVGIYQHFCTTNDDFRCDLWVSHEMQEMALVLLIRLHAVGL